MQSFAIIPAAGLSRRMGRPKLLLPWRRGTVIEQVLATWRSSRVDRVILVVHPHDDQLARLAAGAGAEVVRPESPPAEMKDSICLGLAHAARHRPSPGDAWLVAPADMPGLSAATIEALLAAYETRPSSGDEGPCIWAAHHAGRRGHPVLFPWSLAGEVAGLTATESLKTLLDRHRPIPVEAGPDALPRDLDTPADYERLKAEFEG